MASLKPKFWDHEDVAAGPHTQLFNFRRIWKLTALLTTVVALIPLAFLAILDYRVTKIASASETVLRTSQFVSNAGRNISSFLGERRSVLNFIVKDNAFPDLQDPARLTVILDHLRKAYGGGFTDLGVIDPLGLLKTYAGPHDLGGKDYSREEWFREVLEQGVSISDIFQGAAEVPHLVIAVKSEAGNGSDYVLRATLEAERLSEFISHEESGMDDAFIIDRRGMLQLPSHSEGKDFVAVSKAVPEDSIKTGVFEDRSQKGRPLIIGYAYIDETPFIVVAVKEKVAFMPSWHRIRTELPGFLIGGTAVIIFVILGAATFLLNMIYLADRRRVAALHEVEYANKMATIGKLAAGIAHEINNPLAIINEKAGLIRDIFTLEKKGAADEKLLGLVDSVIASVERCATITRRLLNFMRHEGVAVSSLKLEEVVQEVLGFLRKEAQYRNIAVSVRVEDDVPDIKSDRGRLQEIFLNVINNAFGAMSDGGHLDIVIKREGGQSVSVSFADDGCGIPAADLRRIFEPFYSTETKKYGTGLGLSITFGLVQEIGGMISVGSREPRGTCFTIQLPLHWGKK